MVIDKMTRPRDPRQAHYTTSPGIVAYMVSRLQAGERDSIWEPCAGRGDLVGGVLRATPQAKIRASEVDPRAVAELKEAFSSSHNLEVACEDVLDVCPEMFDEHHAAYTRVIANPPYGGWQEFERRRDLKDRFPDLYVRETYAVFLYRAFLSLKPGGRLVFIVPDTFLWLHRHEFLRSQLFHNARIEELALFPSHFFPGIHFGYSGLCIITLVKEAPKTESVMRVLDDFRDARVLASLADGGAEPNAFRETLYSQKTLLKNPRCEFHISISEGQSEKLHSCNAKLGEMAAIVTGFYSGNDRRHLRVSSDQVRGSRHYLPIDTTTVATFPEGMYPSLDGLDDERCFIPILRGGAARFLKPTSWYVDWSRQAVASYTRRGKNPARFQNARFYFREGIGVPMVASANLTAALLRCRLFDQGIVGVFPHDQRYLKYILAYLNTKLACELLREINPTANNSANYLKRLPFPIPSAEDLAEIDSFVDAIVTEGEMAEEVLPKIEMLIRRIWNRPSSQVEESPRPGGPGLK